MVCFEGSATDPAASVAARLTILVRAAATMVPQVARLITRCTSELDPGRELAQVCGQLASAHVELRTRLADLRLAAEPTTSEQVQHVDRLVNNQLQLVTQASSLAFRPRSLGWYRVAARFGDGWGEPADELVRLAAELTRSSQ